MTIKSKITDDRKEVKKNEEDPGSRNMKLIFCATRTGAKGVALDCSSGAVNSTHIVLRRKKALASFIKTSTHCMKTALNARDKEVSEHVRNRNLWHIVAVEAKYLSFS